MGGEREGLGSGWRNAAIRSCGIRLEAQEFGIQEKGNIAMQKREGCQEGPRPIVFVGKSSWGPREEAKTPRVKRRGGFSGRICAGG